MGIGITSLLVASYPARIKKGVLSMKKWGFLTLLVAIVLVGIIPIDWEKVSGGRLTIHPR